MLCYDFLIQKKNLMRGSIKNNVILATPVFTV